MDTLSLIPQRGCLMAKLFENEHIKLPLTLFYSIFIPLSEIEVYGEKEDTEVMLEWIRFPVRSWRELANQEFRLPPYPEEGYVDGSVYLGHVHNPADVDRIKFGELRGNTISIEIDIAFDFEQEGPAEFGVVDVQWKIEIEVDPDELDNLMIEAQRRGAII